MGSCMNAPEENSEIKRKAKKQKNEGKEQHEEKQEQSPQKKQKKKFEVKPFAVMRLTHEAVRAGFKDIRSALEKVDDKCTNLKETEFTEAYNRLVQCIIVHAQQEDDVFFPLLNEKFDDIVTKKGIPPKHDDDEKIRTSLSDMLQNGCDSKEILSELLNEWIDAHEAHLKLEEEVMMPLTKKTAETVEGRGAIVRKIINVDRKEFSEYQFEYVLIQLVKTKPFGAVMMYCKAVQMSSTPEEYAEVKGKIPGFVGNKMWQQLKKKGVDEEGKQ